MAQGKKQTAAKAQVTAPEYTVELLPIDALIPYENNPRRNEHAVAKVAGSIKEFGFRSPVTVDKDMVIVAGIHGCWRRSSSVSRMCRCM